MGAISAALSIVLLFIYLWPAERRKREGEQEGEGDATDASRPTATRWHWAKGAHDVPVTRADPETTLSPQRSPCGGFSRRGRGVACYDRVRHLIAVASSAARDQRATVLGGSTGRMSMNLPSRLGYLARGRA